MKYLTLIGFICCALSGANTAMAGVTGNASPLAVLIGFIAVITAMVSFIYTTEVYQKGDIE